MTDKTTSAEVKPIEKSVEVTQKSDLDRVVDLVGSLTKNQEETLKSFNEKFAQIENSIKALSEKPKAMETPTDFPAKPKNEDEEDVGAKVEAPKDWYQSQSQQGSITEASKEPNSSDKPDLKMEQKAAKVIHTETPRPSGISDILKSREAAGYTSNPILKEFRELGYNEGVGAIAARIRSGKYHNEPSALSPLGVNY